MITIKKFQTFAVWGDLYVSNKFYIAYMIIPFLLIMNSHYTLVWWKISCSCLQTCTNLII